MLGGSGARHCAGGPRTPNVSSLNRMTNAEIAAAFDELAVLYELDGAVKYRVLAYSNAARAIRESPVSVAELARAGKATGIPGVGKTLEGKIVTLLETGDIPSAERLRAKFPPTLIEVTRVPHLGAKTARRLYDELDVCSLEDLRAAAEAQRIRELKGLGPKVEENILASLEQLADAEAPPAACCSPRCARSPRSWPQSLRSHPAAIEVEVAGSVRRWAETCKDIDLIATAEEPEQLSRAPRRPPAGRRRRHSGSQRRARPDPQRRLGRPAHRRARGLRQPAAALHRLGGAQRRSFARTRSRAASRSPSTGSPRSRPARSRSAPPRREVYERLGYAYIEPELREDRGELRAAREGTLPELVEVARRPRRAALPHDPLRRAQHAGGDGGGRPRPRLRLHGDHRPLGEPRVRRPRHRRAALEADRARSGSGTRASAASASSPAPRSTSAPTARSTTPTTCSPRSTG